MIHGYIYDTHTQRVHVYTCLYFGYVYMLAPPSRAYQMTLKMQNLAFNYKQHGDAARKYLSGTFSHGYCDS